MNSWVPKWLFSVTPPQWVLTMRRALLPWTDPVHPVVLVGKATAGPAQDGRIKTLQRLDHVVADAAGVGDRRVLADPKPFVDAAAQVLGEVTVDVLVDGYRAEIRPNDDAIHTTSSFQLIVAKKTAVTRETTRRSKATPGRSHAQEQADAAADADRQPVSLPVRRIAWAARACPSWPTRRWRP